MRVPENQKPDRSDKTSESSGDRHDSERLRGFAYGQTD